MQARVGAFRRTDQSHAVVSGEEVEDRCRQLMLVLLPQRRGRRRSLAQARCSGAVMGCGRFDVVEHGACGRFLRMIGTRRSQSLGRKTLVEEVSLVRELVEDAVARDEQALVHRVHLVEAEEIQVGTECSNVGQAVGRERHTVDDRASTDRARRRGHLGNRVLLADDVRAMREADDSCVVGQEVTKAVDIEQPRRWVDPPFLEGGSRRCGHAPDCARVRFVILIRHDHFVAGAEQLPERLGDHIGIHRRRRTKLHLVGRHAKRLGPAGPAGIHLFACGRRWRVAGVGLDLGVGVVAMQRVDGLAARERAAGVFEEGLALVLRQRERREVRADEFEIERSHDQSLGSRVPRG